MPISNQDVDDAFGTDEADWDKGEKVSTGGNFEGTYWDFKTDKVVKGVYVGNEPGVKTKFGERTIYHLQDGETLWNIWETAQLKQAFRTIEEGDRVRITYEGKEQTNRGNQVNTFSIVRIKKDAK